MCLRLKARPAKYSLNVGHGHVVRVFVAFSRFLMNVELAVHNFPFTSRWAHRCKPRALYTFQFSSHRIGRTHRGNGKPRSIFTERKSD